jgi:hypothetical protein
MNKIPRISSVENVDSDNLIHKSINGENGKTKLRTTYNYTDLDEDNSRGYVGQDVYEK